MTPRPRRPGQGKRRSLPEKKCPGGRGESQQRRVRQAQAPGAPSESPAYVYAAAGSTGDAAVFPGAGARRRRTRLRHHLPETVRFQPDLGPDPATKSHGVFLIGVLQKAFDSAGRYLKMQRIGYN